MNAKDWPSKVLPTALLMIGSAALIAGVALPASGLLSEKIRTTLIEKGGLANYSATLVLCGLAVLGIFYALKKQQDLEGLVNGINVKDPSKEAQAKKIETLTESIKKDLSSGTYIKPIDEALARIEKTLQAAASPKAPSVDLGPVLVALAEIGKEIKAQKVAASVTPPAAAPANPATTPSAFIQNAPPAPAQPPVSAPATATASATNAAPISPALEKMLQALQQRLEGIDVRLRQKQETPAPASKSVESVEQDLKAHMSEQSARLNAELSKISSLLQEQTKAQTQEIRSGIEGGRNGLKEIQESLARLLAPLQNSDALQGIKGQVHGLGEKLDAMSQKISSLEDKKLLEDIQSQVKALQERIEQTASSFREESQGRWQSLESGLAEKQKSLEQILQAQNQEKRIESVQKQISRLGERFHTLGENLRSEWNARLQGLESIVTEKHGRLEQMLGSLDHKEQFENVQKQMLEIGQKFAALGESLHSDAKEKWLDIRSNIESKHESMGKILAALESKKEIEELQYQVLSVEEKLGGLQSSLHSESETRLLRLYEALANHGSAMLEKHESLSRKLASLAEKEHLEKLQQQLRGVEETLGSKMEDHTSAAREEMRSKLETVEKALTENQKSLESKIWSVGEFLQSDSRTKWQELRDGLETKHAAIVETLGQLAGKEQLEKLQGQLVQLTQSVESKIENAAFALSEKTQAKLGEIQSLVSERSNLLEEQLGSLGHEEKFQAAQKQISELGASIMTRVSSLQSEIQTKWKSVEQTVGERYTTLTQKMGLLSDKKQVEALQKQFTVSEASLRDKLEKTADSLAKETQAKWQAIESSVAEKQKRIEQMFGSLGYEEQFEEVQKQCALLSEKLGVVGKSLQSQLQASLQETKSGLENQHASLQKTLATLGEKEQLEQMQQELAAVGKAVLSKLEQSTASWREESGARWRSLESQAQEGQKLTQLARSDAESRWHELQKMLESGNTGTKRELMDLAQTLDLIRKDWNRGQEELSKKLLFHEVEASFQKLQKQVAEMDRRLASSGQSWQAENKSMLQEMRKDMEAQFGALDHATRFDKLQKQLAETGSKLSSMSEALGAESRAGLHALQQSLASQSSSITEKYESLAKALALLQSQQAFQELQNQIAALDEKVKNVAPTLQADAESRSREIRSILATQHNWAKEKHEDLASASTALRKESQAKWDGVSSQITEKQKELLQKLGSLGHEEKFETVNHHVNHLRESLAAIHSTLQSQIASIAPALQADSESQFREMQSTLSSQHAWTKGRHEELLQKLGHEKQFEAVKDQVTGLSERLAAMGAELQAQSKEKGNELRAALNAKHLSLTQLLESLNDRGQSKLQSLQDALLEKQTELEKQIHTLNYADKFTALQGLLGETGASIGALGSTMQAQLRGQWKEIREQLLAIEQAIRENISNSTSALSKEGQEQWTSLAAQLAALSDKLLSCSEEIQSSSRKTWQELREDGNAKQEIIAQKLGGLRSQLHTDSEAKWQKVQEAWQHNRAAWEEQQATMARTITALELDLKKNQEELRHSLEALQSKQPFEEIQDQVRKAKLGLQEALVSLDEGTQSKLQALESSIRERQSLLEEMVRSLPHDDKFERVEQQIGRLGEAMSEVAESEKEQVQELHSLMSTIGDALHEKAEHDFQALRAESQAKWQELEDEMRTQHEMVSRQLTPLATQKHLHEIQAEISSMDARFREKMTELREAFQAESEAKWRDVQSAWESNLHSIQQKQADFAQILSTFGEEDRFAELRSQVEKVRNQLFTMGESLQLEADSKESRLHSVLEQNRLSMESKIEGLASTLSSMQADKSLQRLQTQISGLSKKLKVWGRVLRADNKSKWKELQASLKDLSLGAEQKHLELYQMLESFQVEMAGMDQKFQELGKVFRSESNMQWQDLQDALESSRSAILEKQMQLERALISLHEKASSPETRNQISALSGKVSELGKALQAEFSQRLDELKQEHSKGHELAMKREEENSAFRSHLQQEIAHLEEENKRVFEVLKHTEATDASIEKALREEIERLNKEYDKLQELSAQQERSHHSLKEDLQKELGRLESENKKVLDVLRHTEETDASIEKVLRGEIHRLNEECARIQELTKRKQQDPNLNQEIQAQLSRLAEENKKVCQILSRTQEADAAIEKMLREEIEKLKSENQNIGEAFQKLAQIDTDIEAELRKRMSSLMESNESSAKTFTDIRNELEKAKSLFATETQWTEERYLQTIEQLKVETERLISLMDLKKTSS